MTSNHPSTNANSTRLLDLLLQAARTWNDREAKQWWYYFYENVYLGHRNISKVSKKKSYSSFNNTIQVLAQVLDKDNLSVLHYIAYYNNVFVCRKLANENCDFNTVGNNGETLLHIAARSKPVNEDSDCHQQKSLLIYLLSGLTPAHKPLVNMDKRDNQGRTALHHAVMTNRIANVQVLLDFAACIAAKDIRQATPLHYACRFNQTNDIVRSLLLRSDSSELQSNKLKWMGESDTQKTCSPICSKADYMNAKTRDGHDAFSLARTYDHEQILNELFQHISQDDLRWQEKDKSISNQIYKAISTEDINILDSYPVWFVINETTGETVLHLACTMGCPTVVSYLLQRQHLDHHGPNAIFLREKQHGFTPILAAASAGQSKCFELMLLDILRLMTTNNHLNTFVHDLFIDRYGRTLLHLAVLSRQINILEILMLNIQTNPFLFVQFIEPMIYTLDYNDETALHLAVRLNLFQMCHSLLRFADKLDEIQAPCIYLDRIDKELIRSTNVYTSNLAFVPTNMLSMLTGSRVYSIGYKNQNGQSSFHIAILHGHNHIMNLFLEHVNTSGRHYLVEHTDANIRTPLQLACLKGYYAIVRELFELNVNVYVRDAEESTALHCVARCVDMKYYDGNDASVLILDLFLQYIQSCKRISFDLLTTIDGFGHNCLETALLARNRSFVEYLLNLNNISLFKNLLRNAQILNIHVGQIDTPFRKLIRCMPDLAYRVLDMCITHIGDKHEAQYKIIYDFEFLEDHCYIQQWQRDMTAHTTTNKLMHKFSCPIFCRHKPLQFRSQFHRQQPLLAYTADPYTLVRNNVLSVMCKCAKQMNLKDHEEESMNVQHSYKLMHHPLCSKLTQLKWRQFGLPLFLVFFIIYCTYLILFTIMMLRNKQPEYFYRLVNASFPKGHHSNGTEMECHDVAQRLVKLNIQEAMKQPTDRILKMLVIILLWIHVCKDALLIIGVHRCSLVWRLYIETIAVILSFICLYDDDPWQSKLKFRCAKQWQVGAFGVFLAWATLLSYLRFIPIFGVYVVMLEVIMLKFLWFVPVLVILICSFSSAFYMLLQNQPVFSTIPFAWFRSVFMVLDTGYEDRFFGPDSDAYISLYPVLFVIFLLFGVTMTILVNNLLTALAVGEIADLSAIARVRNATRRYELLSEWEIFRLQCLWTPGILHCRHEHIEKNWNRHVQQCFQSIYEYAFLKTNV